MTHDPLCPLCGMTTIDLAALRGLSKRTLRRIEASSISCQCDLIGKVRQDERDSAVKRIKSMPWSHENWIAFDERAAIIATIRAAAITRESM